MRKGGGQPGHPPERKKGAASPPERKKERKEAWAARFPQKDNKKEIKEGESQATLRKERQTLMRSNILSMKLSKTTKGHH